MQPTVAAHAEHIDDRGSSHDNCAAAPPEPEPPRRRWWARFGSAFVDGPNDGKYARRWQAACGQGG